MRAMVVDRLVSLDEDREPLSPVELPLPEPHAGEVRIRVCACGVGYHSLRLGEIKAG